MLNTEKAPPGGEPETGPSECFTLNYDNPAGASSYSDPIIENISDELKALDQWLLWKWELDKKSRWTKVPKKPMGYNASSTNPKTWSSFQTAWEAYQDGGFDGIGFVFSETDDFIGIDLDHILDESGNVKGSEPWALEILEQFRGAYTELSPSGDGLHIIVRGSLPESGGNDGKPGDQPHIEIYQSGRYFTFTGDLWSNDNAND